MAFPIKQRSSIAKHFRQIVLQILQILFQYLNSFQYLNQTSHIHFKLAQYRKKL